MLKFLVSADPHGKSGRPGGWGTDCQPSYHETL